MSAGLHEGELRTPLLQQIRRTLREEVDPGFGFVAPGPPAWTRLARPLEECRVALVTTAGFHLADDAPFRALEERLGDTSFRVVPHDAPDAALALDAPYVEQQHAPRDPEVALPRRALEELAREGFVRAAAPRHYSFVGGVVRPLPGLEESAAELVRLLREDAVDVVVALPTCSLCVQTVGLVARALEREGLATVCLSLIPELSEIVRPPRTLCVKFPFGAPAGDAGNAALHRAVLREALQLVADAEAPPAPAHSQARWRR